jgi:neurofibromin 1
MSSSLKPVEWTTSLIERFQDQLPVKAGELTEPMRNNIEQKKDCLISLSKHKYSLVINGLTYILRSIEQLKYNPTSDEQEKNYYESYIIVLDTLEKCITSQPKDTNTTRLDEAMYVNKLLPVLGKLVALQFDVYPMSQVKQLASNVLFALSVNNFNALFSKILARLEKTNDEFAQQQNETNSFDLGELNGWQSWNTFCFQPFRRFKKSCFFLIILRTHTIHKC